MSSAVDELEDEGEELVAAPDTFIPLSDPDVTLDDLAAVESVIRSSRLSSGPVVEDFEAAFAAYLREKIRCRHIERHVGLAARSGRLRDRPWR